MTCQADIQEDQGTTKTTHKTQRTHYMYHNTCTEHLSDADLNIIIIVASFQSAWCQIVSKSNGEKQRKARVCSRLIMGRWHGKNMLPAPMTKMTKTIETRSREILYRFQMKWAGGQKALQRKRQTQITASTIVYILLPELLLSWKCSALWLGSWRWHLRDAND